MGEQIVQRSRRVMELLNDIVKQANLSKGLDGGYLRLAAFRSAASHILPEVMAEFCRRYPAIAVNIAEYDDAPEVDDALRRGRCDIGITYLPTDSGFDTWELLRDEFVVLVPPNTALEGQLDWATLENQPLIMSPEGDVCDNMVYAHCQPYDVTLRPTYQVRSDATIVNMVAKGLGMTISPRLATEPVPPGVAVYSLPVPLFRIITVAVPRGALLTPAAYMFLELMQEMVCESQR
ncbi:MAG: LysR family transcriptional regulator substrate-binding protein [Cyanobacteria bacterium P01_A01_bin.135]